MTNELADPPTLAETPPAIALDARESVRRSWWHVVSTFALMLP
jgi:hypothetical protein